MAPVSKVNPVGGSGLAEGRDSWCTPKWLAALLRLVDLDPCANSRSHIQSRYSCNWDLGENGLYLRPGCFHKVAYDGEANEHWSVFLNPGYNRGEVLKWINHYGHTRFVFLLRWDTSTKWFKTLLPKCNYVWFPSQRVNFEPPPGVKSSSNPYPHALYLRKPSEELLARLRGAGYLLHVDAELLRHYIGDHESDHRQDHAVRGAGGKGEGGAGGGGGGVPPGGGDAHREDAEAIDFERGGCCSGCGYAWWICQCPDQLDRGEVVRGR